MVLGRRVAMAFAAALCLSLVIGVLGARAAEAAVQSKSAVTVTVTVSPPTEVYGVLDQVFSVTIAPPTTGKSHPRESSRFPICKSICAHLSHCPPPGWARSP